MAAQRFVVSMDKPGGIDSEGLALPQPDADAIAYSNRLVEAIVARIDDRGGVIGFDEYMRMALYEPGLGYYSGNAIKFGVFGDFVTAPEISPLFGNCLARQASELIAQGCAARILEFGAGSGKLCGHILSALPSLERYLILDLSADLKQRQQFYLSTCLDAEQLQKVEWLTSLPETFDGIVIANEVLDAMPVQLLYKQQDWQEVGVGYDGERFEWRYYEPSERPLAAIRQIESRLGDLPDDYRCEVNLNFGPWFAALAQSCHKAAVFIIDYGYEQSEYYSPSRKRGTLDCYYRHRLHFDPLIFPGLQDITAFVDFDACADAAEASGFEPLGLVSQGQFLLANGLLEDAQRQSQDADVHEQLALSQQVKTLSMPDEMGQQFQVLALQKQLSLEMPAMRRGRAGG
jgi:SAM-dependent MidA family methyltransferase